MEGPGGVEDNHAKEKLGVGKGRQL